MLFVCVTQQRDLALINFSIFFAHLFFALTLLSLSLFFVFVFGFFNRFFVPHSAAGEYYCEATNQINTIDYVVRSSNIVLGEFWRASHHSINWRDLNDTLLVFLLPFATWRGFSHLCMTWCVRVDCWICFDTPVDPIDVFGLPAFLTKVTSPYHAFDRSLTLTTSHLDPFSFQSPSNMQGRKGDQSEVSLWFCADPPPNNVFWKFGSIQLDAIKWVLFAWGF